MIDDTRATAKALGFDPHTITVPVQLWYGEADLVGSTPPISGRTLADAIPENTLHLLPDEAHEAFFTHFAEVLDAALP
jgi:pimeloyl-ACP methyl ester carboxylesterase